MYYFCVNCSAIELQISATPEATSCYSDRNDGSLTITATGGTAPYTYSVQNILYSHHIFDFIYIVID